MTQQTDDVLQSLMGDTEISAQNTATLSAQEAEKPSFSYDAGAHYRFQYKGLNLDPFRICEIYGIGNLAQATIVKKALCTGKRGHKDTRQDLKDIICAVERWLQMLDEDEQGQM